MSCDVPFVYLEAALGITEPGGDVYLADHEPVEDFGADAPVQALCLLDMTAVSFSGAVCDIARSVFK